MELWIRSQDRKILKKVNGIEFIQSGSPLYDGVKYSIYESDEDGKKIGEYKTEKRTLEVLDEIQNILIDYSKMSRVVYQMPED